MYDPRYNPVQFQKADARMFNSGAKMQQNAMNTLLGMTQKIQGQEKEFQDKMVLDNTANVINQINRQATQGDLDMMALPDGNAVDLNALNAAMQTRGSTLYNQGQDEIKNTYDQDKLKELAKYHEGQLANSRISANASMMNAGTSRGNLGLNRKKYNDSQNTITQDENGNFRTVSKVEAKNIQNKINSTLMENMISDNGSIEDKTRLKKINKYKETDPNRYKQGLEGVYKSLVSEKNIDQKNKNAILNAVRKEETQKELKKAGVSPEQIANRKLSSALWSQTSKELNTFEADHSLNEGEGLDISGGAKKALMSMGLTKNDVDFAELMNLIADGIGKKGDVINGKWFANQGDAKDIALALLGSDRGKALVLKSGEKTQNQMLNLVDENKNKELAAQIEQLKKEGEEYKKVLKKNNIRSQHEDVTSWGQKIMRDDFWNKYE